MAANKEDLEKEGRRIEFVDLAKGVCIMLVCVFHSDLGPYLPSFTNMLRLPLYFILSGLFYKDYGGFFRFVEKKINRILVPGLFFYFAGIIFFFTLYFFNISEGYGIKFGGLFNNWILYNFPIWFLFSLFEINIIFVLIERSCGKSLWRIGFSCLLCGFLGYLLSINDIRLIFYLDSSLTALPFFFVGYLLRKAPILYKNEKDNLYFLIGIILLLCCIFIDSYLHGYVKFAENKYAENMPVITVILSITTVISSLLILKKIKWLPVISYLGRYSIIVLGTHALYIFALRRFIPVTHPFFLPIIFLLCALSIPICKEFLPYLTAQKDWFKWSHFKGGLKKDAIID